MSSNFEPNPNFERELEEMVRAQLQPRADAAVQDAAREVRDAYNGESAQEVYDKITELAKRNLGPDLAPGYRPNEAVTMEIATAITRGELAG